MAGGVNPKDILGQTKVSLSKVPTAAIIYEALAMVDGAKKYGPFNWRKNKVIASIYVDACLRHVGSWFDGEEIATDSLVHHLGHARACLGILIDALETGNLDDDRPPSGPAARLLEESVVKDLSIPEDVSTEECHERPSSVLSDLAD
ncbi:hypothetical protein LCGC14_0651620 [marine sediment metagenome]|uniref:dATP/dGTP diphosphohydrolase N-terminal domain-containing protein n=1 Tax=marine sediment metagenome TaxID=412755 RepID=A0A0F9QW39_9ZZZZ